MSTAFTCFTLSSWFTTHVSWHLTTVLLHGEFLRVLSTLTQSVCLSQRKQSLQVEASQLKFIIQLIIGNHETGKQALQSELTLSSNMMWSNILFCKINNFCNYIEVQLLFSDSFKCSIYLIIVSGGNILIKYSIPYLTTL